MVSIRQLILGLLAVALAGCSTSSEKLPDMPSVGPEARIKEIQSSNMPEPAKQAAIARIQAEQGNAQARGQDAKSRG